MAAWQQWCWCCALHCPATAQPRQLFACMMSISVPGVQHVIMHTHLPYSTLDCCSHILRHAPPCSCRPLPPHACICAGHTARGHAHGAAARLHQRCVQPAGDEQPGALPAGGGPAHHQHIRQAAALGCRRFSSEARNDCLPGTGSRSPAAPCNVVRLCRPCKHANLVPPLVLMPMLICVPGRRGCAPHVLRLRPASQGGHLFAGAGGRGAGELAAHADWHGLVAWFSGMVQYAWLQACAHWLHFLA